MLSFNKAQLKDFLCVTVCYPFDTIRNKDSSLVSSCLAVNHMLPLIYQGTYLKQKKKKNSAYLCLMLLCLACIGFS